MSDTPRTDANIAFGFPVHVRAEFARKLERELAEAKPVMDMLLLDGNVGPELKGAEKLRAIIDALIEARTAAAPSEYICKCGVRVTKHRCKDGMDF